MHHSFKYFYLVKSYYIVNSISNPKTQNPLVKQAFENYLIMYLYKMSLLLKYSTTILYGRVPGAFSQKLKYSHFEQ